MSFSKSWHRISIKNIGRISREQRSKYGSDYDNIEITDGLTEGQEVVSGPFIVVSKRLKGGENIKAAGNGNKNRSEKNDESSSDSD